MKRIFLRGKDKRTIGERDRRRAEPGLQPEPGDLRLHQEQRIRAGHHGAGGLGQELRLRQQDLHQGSAAEALPHRQHPLDPLGRGAKQLPHAEDHHDQDLARPVSRIHLRANAVDSTDHPPYPAACPR